MEYMKNGGNTPTNPDLWNRAKAAAKAKYDVYPSAYANGYAAKWYKERGGGWKKAEMGGTMPLQKYQVAGPVGETAAEKKKRMYDLAMEQYQMLMETPAMWENDPDMKTPDGKFNLCLDCINVDWSNPDDIMDAHRLIEEGYSLGTHYAEKEFHDGLKALGVPMPVYNSKPVVRPTFTSQKANGGTHYGAYAPPMFASGGMPCYECGGMYAEGGTTNCPPGLVPDGQGNCISDLSTPPTQNSSFFDYYQNLLEQPGMSEALARKTLKSKRQCNPGDECWEETQELIENVTTPREPDPFNGMERLYIDLTEADYDKVPAKLKEGTHGNMYIRNRVPYGWKAADGTVYYERGVPGTPGYQGRFSSKPTTANYHFVEELDQRAFGGAHFDIPFEEYAEGGGIPERYKNMGFTKVGVKKESTSPGKKWMVLAKKGDQYKVVHGGYDGMKDYTQHGSEERRERFWDRMGGRDSAKAKDPFSPLYWHKRFGTWENGGELPEMQYAGTAPDYESMIQAGDHTVDTTYKRQLNNLEMNGWNKGLAVTNSLVDPRSALHMLPDKGFGSGLKGIVGLAAGLSGATLGYEKMFAKDRTDRGLYNNETGEYGKREDILKARWDKANPAAPAAPVMPTIPTGLENVMNNVQVKRQGGNILPKHQWKATVENEQPEFKQWVIQNSMRPDVMAAYGDESKLMDIWAQETGAGAPFKTPVGPVVKEEQPQVGKPAFQQDWTQTQRGDAAGFMAANNALIGLGMFDNALGQKNLKKQYDKQLMQIGNTDAMYNAVNPSNPYGNYTTNVGIGPDFALVRQTAAQDFSDANLARYGGTMKKYKQGGSYMVSDRELMEILANGGDVEFL